MERRFLEKLKNPQAVSYNYEEDLNELCERYLQTKSAYFLDLLYFHLNPYSSGSNEEATRRKEVILSSLSPQLIQKANYLIGDYFLKNIQYLNLDSAGTEAFQSALLSL